NARNECGNGGILEAAEVPKDAFIDRFNVRRDYWCCWEHLAGSNDNTGQCVPLCNGILELLGGTRCAERLYRLKKWPDQAFHDVGWVKPVNPSPNLIAPHPG